jgi:hypothetical protein
VKDKMDGIDPNADPRDWPVSTVVSWLSQVKKPDGTGASAYAKQTLGVFTGFSLWRFTRPEMLALLEREDPEEGGILYDVLHDVQCPFHCSCDYFIETF